MGCRRLGAKARLEGAGGLGYDRRRSAIPPARRNLSMPSILSTICSVSHRQPVALLIFLLSFSLPAAISAQDGFHVDPTRSVEKQREAASKASAVARRGGVAAAEVIRLLDDPSGVVRDRVFGVIERDWSDEEVSLLLKGITRGGPLALETVAEVCGRRRLGSSVHLLGRILEGRGAEGAREMAAWALGEIGSEEGKKSLEKVARREKSSFRVRCEAIRSLARVAGAAAREVIDEALADRRMLPVRIAALEALEVIDPQAALRAALTALGEPPRDRRRIWSSRIERAALAVIERQATPERELQLLKETIDVLVEESDGSQDLARIRFLEVFEAVTGVESLPRRLQAWHGWWRARREFWTPPDGATPAGLAPAPKKRQGTSVVRLHGVPLDSNRVLILQDVSGGMSRTVDGSFDGGGPTRLEISRGELDRLLKSLPGSAWVQVVYFASRAMSASEVPQQLAKARGRLLEFNSRQKVPTGHGLARGNIHDPLAAALFAPQVDTVYLLTEGAPTEGKYHDYDRLRFHVERLNRLGQVRIHVLLVGRTGGKNRQFLDALAGATGGMVHDVSDRPPPGE